MITKAIIFFLFSSRINEKLILYKKYFLKYDTAGIDLPQQLCSEMVDLIALHSG